MPKLRPPITDLHFQIFGQIISAYAMDEQLLKAALSCALKVDLRIISALTHRMNATDLQKKISALANDLLEAETRDELLDLSRRLGEAGTIRNKIAHTTWAPGASPDSLRSSEIRVKHSGIDVLGFEDSEPEYSMGDFDKCAENLSELSRDIIAFLKRHDFPGSNS